VTGYAYTKYIESEAYVFHEAFAVAADVVRPVSYVFMELDPRGVIM
jgi:hypothetical protein